jgi:hypothetical protein
VALILFFCGGGAGPLRGEFKTLDEPIHKAILALRIKLLDVDRVAKVLSGEGATFK